jgi:hypothetical protein
MMKVTDEMRDEAMFRLQRGCDTEFDELNLCRVADGRAQWVDDDWWRRIIAEIGDIEARETAAGVMEYARLEAIRISRANETRRRRARLRAEAASPEIAEAMIAADRKAMKKARRRGDFYVESRLDVIVDANGRRIFKCVDF